MLRVPRPDPAAASFCSQCLRCSKCATESEFYAAPQFPGKSLEWGSKQKVLAFGILAAVVGFWFHRWSTDPDNGHLIDHIDRIYCSQFWRQRMILWMQKIHETSWKIKIWSAKLFESYPELRLLTLLGSLLFHGGTSEEMLISRFGRCWEHSTALPIFLAMADHQLWEVVGGVDKGGILVRSGRELSSPDA